MTKLSVNVNKIATIRNARGKNMPDIVEVASDILGFGAHGITVHPRPDGRHIRTEDVYALAQLIREVNDNQEKFPQISKRFQPDFAKVEFNVEGYPSPEFLAMMREVRPDQVTLVPDPPDVITSNAGWDLKKNKAFLVKVIGELDDLNIRSSLFVDVFTMQDNEIQALLEIRPKRVEFYTEKYAENFGGDNQDKVLQQYKDVAAKINELGLEINAGHDLNLKNILPLVQAIPVIKEVSIGHALVCEALYLGLERVVQAYLERLNGVQ